MSNPEDPRSITADFDAFEAAHPLSDAEVRYARIRGHVVPVPTDMPARMLFRDVGSMSNPDPAAVRGILVGFYGEAVLEAWFDGEGAPDRKPVGLQGLMVILAWSTLNAQGDPVTFEQAAQRVADAQAEEKRKAEGVAKANASLGTAAGGATDAAQAAALAAHEQAVADAGKALSSGTGAPWKPTSDASTGFGPPSWPSSGPESSGSFWRG